MTINVLFVCLGNICRSPAAQGVFESMVAAAGLSNVIKADSCGTAPFNIGKNPDPRSIQAASRAGYNISKQIARQIEDSDYLQHGYIIAMDRINLISIEAWAPSDYSGEINLFMSYCQRGGNTQIPDPYYDDENKFDNVIASLEYASAGLLNYIVEKNHLIAPPQ